jgi:type I site-specific restriction endonuclease
MKKFVLLLSLLASVVTHAEVYRWTDANGKVHYGDKKPKAAAEDITEKVNQVNVDTSTEERKKLETIFRKENEADREFKREQAKPDAEFLAWCKETRRYLKNISGLVQFVDKDGKAIHVTEEQRTQKVEETKALLKKRRCPE